MKKFLFVLAVVGFLFSIAMTVQAADYEIKSICDAQADTSGYLIHPCEYWTPKAAKNGYWIRIRSGPTADKMYATALLAGQYGNSIDVHIDESNSQTYYDETIMIRIKF